MHEALDAAVEVLGVLADDDEVDVLGLLALDRALDAGEQLHRAEVDVLVEAEAQVEQQLALEDAGLHVGVADGAEEDAVELAELVEAVGGEGFAGLEVAIAAPVEMLEVLVEAFELGDGLEDFDALGRYFRSGAVAADDCDLTSFCHGKILCNSFINHEGHEEHEVDGEGEH